MKEFRVYVVDTDNQFSELSVKEMTNEQFMAEAEMLGTVYTFEGFEKAFNNGEIQSDTDYIEYVKFKETFGEDGNILVIGTQSKDVFKLNFFNDLYDLCNEIEGIDGVEKVISITKAYNLQRNDSLGSLNNF